MQLKAVVKEALGVFREFGQALISCALGVTLLSLLALGFLSVWGLSGREVLELYTPLLLGLFSIGITLYLFQRNVSEGRERARKDRNDAVRPIIIIQGEKYENPEMTFADFECYVSSPEAENCFVFSVHNSGLGTALGLSIHIITLQQEYYRVHPEIHKLMPNESNFITLYYSLPEKPLSILSRCEDVYGNVHFFSHWIDRRSDGREFIKRNDYIDCSPADEDEYHRKIKGPARAKRLLEPRFKPRKILNQNKHPEG